MSTNWIADQDPATDFNTYDDALEHAIGFPTVFDEPGFSGPDVRSVPDYGCGPGKVSLRVAETFDIDVVAVDISEHMLEIARRRRPHPRIGYHFVPGGQLDFLADETMDAAMTCFAFETMGDLGLIRSIAVQVFRVLAPGCSLCVLDDNPAATGIRFSTFCTGEPGRS